MSVKKGFSNVAQLVRTSRAASLPRLSQVDLAKLVGYSCGNYISSIERGISDVPDYNIRAYADALNIPFQHILDAKCRDLEVYHTELRVEDKVNVDSGRVGK